MNPGCMIFQILNATAAQCRTHTRYIYCNWDVREDLQQAGCSVQTGCVRCLCTLQLCSETTQNVSQCVTLVWVYITVVAALRIDLTAVLLYCIRYKGIERLIQITISSCQALKHCNQCLAIICWYKELWSDNKWWVNDVRNANISVDMLALLTQR